MLAYRSPEERFEALTSVWKNAIKASFYRDKYAQIPAMTSWEDWRKIPYLTRQEVYDNAFPRSRSMLTRPVEGMVVIATGGSSGVARHTVLTHAEWDHFAAVQAAALGRLGVVPEDLVANLFVAGNLWPSFLGGHEILKRLGAVHLPISAGAKAEDVIGYCQDFKATVMLSLPTALVFYADAAIHRKIELPSLRLALYAGEQMSVEAEKHFRKAFPNARVKAVAYSSADAGLMGYQCSCCGFGEYHLPTGFQHLEILDPETGQAVPDGVKGEIFVTNLARFSMPIVRYRLGDLAEFLANGCSCGDKNPLFRLSGRAGDDFKLGGAYISLDVFDQVLSEFGAKGGLGYCLILEDVGNQVDIVLQVETAEPAASVPFEEGILKRLKEEIPEFKVGHELNYIRKLGVEFVAIGSLPKNTRTGKTKRVWDKRVVG